MSNETKKKIEITPAMIEAGVTVLSELAGEVSRDFVAREVYLAMVREVREPESR